MNNSKTNSDMAALAEEVCDLWQDHLANLANDQGAKAEMSRLLEPQRQLFTRLFADYALMMQHKGHDKTGTHSGGAEIDEKASRRATSSATASPDSSLSLAQLAHRVATLEERLAKLETRPKRGA